MKCWGLTRTFKRCSRQAPHFFCHDHRRVVIWSAFSMLLALLWHLNVPQNIFHKLISSPPKMPHLLITTMPIDAPGGSDRPVSFSGIRDRRIHILKLTNPNEASLSRVELQIQFPEALLDITSGESPSYYKVEAAENWDRQPVTVSGDISDSEV